MKTIQPVSVWVSGEVKTATRLHCVISYDDMASYATFTYTLQEVVPPAEGLPEGTAPMNVPVANGFVTMSGQDYQDWDDSNDAAYQFVADHLNLTIVVPQ